MAGGAAQRSDLTAGRLAAAAGPLFVLAVLVNCTIVAVAVQAVNVPGDNEMIDFPVLLFASIGPVLGNCIGFLLSYRRPSRASLVGFLAPGIIITAVFVVLAVREFGEHDDVGVLVTALLVTVAPTIVAVAGLLRRRSALVGQLGGAVVPGGYAPAGLGPPAGGPVPRQVPAARPPVSGTAEWDPHGLGPAQPPAGPPGRTGEWRPDQLQPPGDAGATATWNLDELGTRPPQDRPPGGRP